MTGTIFPTITDESWSIFVGTPWVVNDGLAYVKATGEYDYVATPVLRDGVPVWPERFDLDEIEKRRRLSSGVQFARMFLLAHFQAEPPAQAAS